MSARRLLIALLLAPIALSGCTTTAADGSESVTTTKQYRGVGTLMGRSEEKPKIYWLSAQRTHASLTTAGSSSCPDVPERIRVVSPTELVLTMKTYTGGCTADAGSPYTTEFLIPDAVSRRQPVVVTLMTTDKRPDQQATLEVAVPS